MRSPEPSHTRKPRTFLVCSAWLLRDQLLAKTNAGFDEIADDKVALSQAQREEAEARIRADMLATERSECSLIWIAESRWRSDRLREHHDADGGAWR